MKRLAILALMCAAARAQFPVPGGGGGSGGGGGDTTVISNTGAGAAVLKAGTNAIGRTIVGGTNVTVTQNTDDIEIAASGSGMADPGGNGLVSRTALNTTINRTLTGTSNEVAVSNPDGVSGNPTVSLASTFDISGKTSTKPIKAGTSVPGTCSVGEMFYDTDATAGQNIYGCTATNTWTLQGDGGGGAAITRTAVSFSATPTFTRSSALQQFTMTLTGNVTSSTLASASAGDMLSFELTQDGTGSRTFVGPTGFPAITLCGTAASRTTLQYFWTGSAAILRSSQTAGCAAPAIVTDAGNVVNVPDANDTFATIAGSQTLTNKSIVATALRLPGSTTLPGTCTVGDTYQDTDATAASQFYLCTATNTWTAQGGTGGGSFDPMNFNTEYFVDQFIGTKDISAGHWNSDGGSWEIGGTCTVVNTAGSVGHDGVLSVSGTANATDCVMRHNSTTFQTLAAAGNVGTEIKWQFRLLHSTLHAFRIGMWDGFSLTNGFGIRFIAGTDTNFQFERDSSGSTVVDSGVALNTASWYVFRMRITATGTWTFDISENGGAWSTAKTACASGCDLGVMTTFAIKPHVLLTPAEAATKTAYVDAFGMKIVRGGVHP